jgi:glyoxylase-like metal-dependent hydrolase (beta-lactamase superfamily II)
MRMGNAADGICQIDTETAAPLSCSCYLKEAAKLCLMETGHACQIQALREALGTRKLSYIISTHGHLDHAGGIGQLLIDSPDIIVVAHDEAVRHLVDPRCLNDGIRQVFGGDFEQVYGSYLPVPENPILPVRDGTVISLGDRTL